jgi:hypothetical protein
MEFACPEPSAPYGVQQQMVQELRPYGAIRDLVCNWFVTSRKNEPEPVAVIPKKLCRGIRGLRRTGSGVGTGFEKGHAQTNK